MLDSRLSSEEEREKEGEGGKERKREKVFRYKAVLKPAGTWTSKTMVALKALTPKSMNPLVGFVILDTEMVSVTAPIKNSSWNRKIFELL